jgi:PAS domain S-box-containing protein
MGKTEAKDAGRSVSGMVGRRGAPPAGLNLLAHVPEMVTISDRRGAIVYANPATERVSGYSPEEFMALDPFERMHPEDRPRCEEAFQELANALGLSISLEHRVRHKDGTWRWVEGTFSSLFDDPEVGGLLATVRDVTERKRAEEALRASEEKYHTLFESIDEGFCIVEVIFDGTGQPVDYRFLEVNPAFERHTGLHDAAGKRMRELEPRHEGHWFETYGRIALTGEPERFQNAARHLDDRFYDVYAFRIGAPKERKVAILFTDITRRREAEEERLRLRALEASAQSEAAERLRIGRELHDRVAHTMAVAHQSLQLYTLYTKSDPTRAAEKLKLVADAIETALDQTRDLSAQLARSQTEETRHGLGAALRDLLDTHVPDEVEATLSVAGDESAIPSPAEEQAFLVMREAVRNAVAHSGCGHIEVSVDVGEAELRGRVEDDGKGFDPPGADGGWHDDREECEPAAGVGLRSMRERTEALGGRLDISSEPGGGSAVEVLIPLAD